MSDVKAREQRRIVDALAKSVAPYLRSLEVGAHCIETSLAGSLALRRFGIEAEAEPCAAVAFSTVKPRVVILGHRFDQLPGELRQLLAGRFTDQTGQEYPLHVAIRAMLADGTRVFCDLTSWQIEDKVGGEIRVPDAVIAEGDGYAQVNGPESAVWYLPCPYPERAAEFLRQPVPSQVVDLMVEFVEHELAKEAKRGS